MVLRSSAGRRRRGEVCWLRVVLGRISKYKRVGRCGSLHGCERVRYCGVKIVVEILGVAY